MDRELLGQAIETLWPEGTLATVFVSEELRPIPREGEIHRAFELNCVVRGGQVRYFPAYHMELGPGDVCLVPPWEPHAWRSTEPRTTCVTVHFLPEFLGEETIGDVSWLTLFARPADQRPGARNREMRREILTFAQYLSRGTPTYTWYERRRLPQSQGAGEALVQLVYQMAPGGRDLPPAWQDGVRHDLIRILITLYRGWDMRGVARQQPVARAGDLSAVMPAIALTMPGSSSVERVDMEEAAKACSLSVTHFRRLFRRTMGMTFGSFEMRQRLAQAERLLHTSTLTLAAIAERCGFSDASHLNRMFRKLHGHTAAQHRIAIQAAVEGKGGDERRVEEASARELG